MIISLHYTTSPPQTTPSSFQSNLCPLPPIAFSPQLHVSHGLLQFSLSPKTHLGADGRSSNVHSCKHDVHFPHRLYRKRSTGPFIGMLVQQKNNPTRTIMILVGFDILLNFQQSLVKRYPICY